MDRAYWKIEVGEGVLGTCIKGVDLNAVVSQTAVNHIKELLWKYRILVFKDQLLTPMGHERFVKQLGPLRAPPLEQCVSPTTYLQRVMKSEDDVYNFGGTWHSDGCFQSCPPMATMLQAIELPKAGGDTLFADCVLAYEELPAALKEKVDSLTGVHRAHGVIDPATYSPDSSQESGVGKSASHPVVGCHPHSKKKYLYVNPTFTQHLLGLGQVDSDALIDELAQHITRPEMIYRHQWNVGDVVLWDNRTTQHCAVNDYSGSRRVMHRSVVYDAFGTV